MDKQEDGSGNVRIERQVRRVPEGINHDEALENEARRSERERILTALMAFLDNGGGSFRKWLEFLGMDYHPAYLEGWMGFTNALCDHESRILGKEPDEFI